MPYTLVKALVWLLVAFAIGVVIGWLLRNATVRREMAKARGDGAEQERLRQRVAELEPLIDERTRLIAELEAARSQRSRAAPAAEPPAEPPTAAPEPASVPVADDVPPADGLDLVAAAAVLGRTVETDDLTVIEGIGPQVAELCHGIGIRTWSDLARTEVSLLRTMLTDAGARYKVHDPESWPAQADLLATGRWDEFQQFVARLAGDVTSS